MTSLESIVQAIEFTEAQLRTPISVADMAEAAGYSLYHFCRMFGKFTRHTPYDYLMRRRMTLAAGEVIQTDRRIVDIALDYQFQSHEGFTRAFQRMFETSPTDARRQGLVQAAFRLPRLTGDHLSCLHQQQGLKPTLSHLPQVDCPSLLNCCPGPDETRYLPVAQVWPLNSVLSARSGPFPQGLYGCFILTEFGEDLPLILDWTLHVWLFYAPYTLRFPYVLVQDKRDGNVQLCVPVAQRYA